MAQTVEFADLDHDADLGSSPRPSSVSHVPFVEWNLTTNRAFL
jgi:hypothetical protein